MKVGTSLLFIGSKNSLLDCSPIQNYFKIQAAIDSQLHPYFPLTSLSIRNLYRTKRRCLAFSSTDNLRKDAGKKWPCRANTPSQVYS